MADHRFTARYPGVCDGCGHRFMPGIEIGFRDGELCCATCLDDNSLDDPTPACPDCRLTHAGECF